MLRSKMLILWALLICMGTVLVAMNGCGGSSSSGGPPPPPSNKIQHVVIIFQENRSPDNLFQDPVLYNAPPAGHGADIAQSGMDSLGQRVTLTPTTMNTDFDLSHAHSAFERMCYGTTNPTSSSQPCTMNGANLIAYDCFGNVTADCPPPGTNLLPFQYVKQSDVQPYWTMAETYTFGDRMFQTNQGPSYPAHQYIISGTTAISETGTTFFAENPLNIYAGDTGCSSPNASSATPDLIQTIDTTNPDYPANEDATSANSPKVYPCVDHNTLIDSLDAKHIPWKYYANVGACPAGGPCPKSGIWVGPNMIQHICQPDSGNTTCTGAEYIANVVPNTNVLTDISGGTLPAVSWVIPDGKNSDHAHSTDEFGGPDWVASIVNAIGNSQYWSNTAILVTWDDWGGWYDHVAPTLRSDNSYEYGFRVPLIVISPYAKPKYVSHVTHDFGSILHFVETQFGLGSIDANGRFADSRADDLSDCFDFSQTPLTFNPITPLKHDAQFFLSDKRPPVDPDDD